ncbi:hypothetical protein F4780DRAFT_361786 [Xylariomycetidae sp. FL0641]|nr:hypothetical protein F4780DRAFT_361786 [Xylariomycetidae sp. FL0641]
MLDLVGEKKKQKEAKRFTTPLLAWFWTGMLFYLSSCWHIAGGASKQASKQAQDWFTSGPTSLRDRRTEQMVHLGSGSRKQRLCVAYHRPEQQNEMLVSRRSPNFPKKQNYLPCVGRQLLRGCKVPLRRVSTGHPPFPSLSNWQPGCFFIWDGHSLRHEEQPYPLNLTSLLSRDARKVTHCGSEV